MTACRTKNDQGNEKPKENTNFFSIPAEDVPELASNRLSAEPTSFLRNQSTSPIHWQPWTPEVLDFAERSQRLIFIFVGSTTHPKAESLAKLLESKFTAEINEKYVPVLADSELDPALALACNLLAMERKDPIAFPFLIWLSHEGNPVAWIPVTSQDEESLLLGFRRAQNTVEAILNKSSRYVVENSRFDNQGRIERIKSRFAFGDGARNKPPTKSELFLTAQSLTDLYDSIDKTFDNTGGIPPGNLITTVARLSAHPAAPPRLQKNAQTASKESVELLAKSAILDPLDGYFFSRRNSQSFAVPALSKSLKTQAEMLSAMSSSPSTPASKQAVTRMLKELDQNPIRATSLSVGETNELAFFWSTNAIEDLLTKEEFTVAKTAFQLKGLGNVPSADDPRRTYFRRNTLGLAVFGAELAQKVGKSEPETEKLLASAIEKLTARRDEILEASNALMIEESSFLGPNARLLTALGRTYAASPQESSLQTLNNLGQQILSDFTTADGNLLRTSATENLRSAPAFAYDYAVTIEALLEWYRVTWDSKLLETAFSLTTTFLDRFLNEDNYLVEANTEEHPLTFPVYSDSMIFGPSTWGISHGVLKRMLSMGHQHPKLSIAIANHAPLLENGLKNAPVIHTDFLLAALNNMDGFALLLSHSQQDNSALRLALAQPEFDSVCTFLSTPNLEDLPSLGENVAILLKDGKKIKEFASTDTILTELKVQIAQ